MKWPLSTGDWAGGEGGPIDDAGSDADLFAHGTEGLFVANVSLMPEIVRCNTNSTAIVIAEHAADLLRGQ